jgi:hypothetical protein
MTRVAPPLSTLLTRAVICCEQIDKDMIPLDDYPQRLTELTEEIAAAHRRPAGEHDRTTEWAHLLMQAVALYVDARRDFRRDKATRAKAVVAMLKPYVQGDLAAAMDQERGAI